MAAQVPRVLFKLGQSVHATFFSKFNCTAEEPWRDHYVHARRGQKNVREKALSLRKSSESTKLLQCRRHISFDTLKCLVRVHACRLVVSTKIKDGDLSTSWTCTGDPRDPSDSSFVYDCTVSFDLFSFRHIKEVRIGEN